MMNKIVSVVFIASVLISCSKDAFPLFDEPFVHIMQNDLAAVEVSTSRRDVVQYYIYFSPANIHSELRVEYTITAGDGLQEGRDYEIITQENPLAFPPGITQRPIQIRWIDHAVDPDKDNTLRITLTGVNLDVNIGLPGPDNNQREFLITKVNN